MLAEAENKTLLLTDVCDNAPPALASVGQVNVYAMTWGVSPRPTYLSTEFPFTLINMRGELENHYHAMARARECVLGLFPTKSSVLSRDLSFKRVTMFRDLEKSEREIIANVSDFSVDALDTMHTNNLVVMLRAHETLCESMSAVAKDHGCENIAGNDRLHDHLTTLVDIMALGLKMEVPPFISFECLRDAHAFAKERVDSSDAFRLVSNATARFAINFFVGCVPSIAVQFGKATLPILRNASLEVPVAVAATEVLSTIVDEKDSARVTAVQLDLALDMGRKGVVVPRSEKALSLIEKWLGNHKERGGELVTCTSILVDDDELRWSSSTQVGDWQLVPAQRTNAIVNRCIKGNGSAIVIVKDSDRLVDLGGANALLRRSIVHLNL